MIVCVCAKVSDRQIRQAALAGAHTLECLQFELGVAVQCGRCADCAQRVLCDARAVAHGPASGGSHTHSSIVSFQPRLA